MECRLCKRDVSDIYIQEHHLIPRSKGGKDVEKVCSDCHFQIHVLFNNNELRDFYYSIDKLLESEKIKHWTKWIRKKKIGERIPKKRLKRKR
jgi:hypothetical protein